MFGLMDQAIVSSMSELMYSGVQFKMLIEKKITEILFLSYNVESLLTRPELCCIINICM